jgi:tetratricopeptide (TPR) repeat protein
MPSESSRIVLPEAPAALGGAPVKAWREPVAIDTYAPAAPDRYPAYLDQRVYQGSSGAVYPLPFIDAIAREKAPRRWDAVHLENEYVRLMILPELGGRIHIGLDKTRGYDFFYRNEVVKPALVGLAGPWVSGGVEFNWPQHHRPATHLPVEALIETEDDGAVTVWCSDHDPFTRMQGMHGIRLRPGSALIELRGHLVNRTDEVQTFLWWANVAAEAGDDYQSFFPTDVRVVADHAKRAMTTFPAAQGRYYGVDYPARRPGGDRLDWYRNIPVPTSYMCLGSEDDFFGGYDHGAGAGFVHWADHRLAPGKKQWTWGNAPFGWAWDAHLTDTGGPYVELMAGVFTDNQPDFAFLAPGETRIFSQYWYPIQDTGPVHQATLDAAVRLDVDGTRIRIAAAVTALRPGAKIVLHERDRVLHEAVVDLAPGAPYLHEFTADAAVKPTACELTVEHDGRILVSWRPRPEPDEAPPVESATEPPLPADIESTDELYLTGVHLAQYRHATRAPEPYWEEALRRDPGDARCNTALAARFLRAGRLEEAERHLRAAVERLTRRNPNPRDGEAHYRLGLVLARQCRDAEAKEAFGKALWDQAWADAATVATARLDLSAGRNETAAADLAALVDRSPRHWQARNLLAVALLRIDDPTQAAAIVRETLRGNLLDAWARDLERRLGGDAEPTHDPSIALDVALEYRSIREDEAAIDLLDAAASLMPAPGAVNVAPLAWVHRADLEFERGDEVAADLALQRVRELDRTWCFPSHTEDDALARLRARRPGDAVLAGLAGHRLYAAGRHREAIAAWEVAAETEDAVVLRNLGVAAHNVDGDPERAACWYELARAAAPDDARLLYESDQLDARRGVAPVVRLAAFENRLDLVEQRDDLSVQFAELLIATGRADEALKVLEGRSFQPWEGGEGRVLAAWEAAHLVLAREAITKGDSATGVAHVDAALNPIPNLGEARHPLANTADLYLLLGDALAEAGDDESACAAWEQAARQQGDFQTMQVQAHSEHTAAAVTALRRLGRTEEAQALRDDLARYVEAQAQETARIDYFATSLPSMLLFTADLQAAHDLRVLVLRAQLAALDGEPERAAVLAAEALEREPLHTAARAVAAP